MTYSKGAPVKRAAHAAPAAYEAEPRPDGKAEEERATWVCAPQSPGVPAKSWSLRSDFVGWGEYAASRDAGGREPGDFPIVGRS
jgi:hypothetical protein